MALYGPNDTPPVPEGKSRHQKCDIKIKCELIYGASWALAYGNISDANQHFHANHTNFNLDHWINIQGAWRIE